MCEWGVESLYFSDHLSGRVDDAAAYICMWAEVSKVFTFISQVEVQILELNYQLKLFTLAG